MFTSTLKTHKHTIQPLSTVQTSVQYTEQQNNVNKKLQFKKWKSNSLSSQMQLVLTMTLDIGLQ